MAHDDDDGPGGTKSNLGPKGPAFGGFSQGRLPCLHSVEDGHRCDVDQLAVDADLDALEERRLQHPSLSVSDTVSLAERMWEQDLDRHVSRRGAQRVVGRTARA
jgi:hypothetical protein